MPTENTPKQTKAKATRLLRKYDKLRTQLLQLEHEAAKACADYGRTIGVWGYRLDHMRMELEREAQNNKNAAA